MMALYNSTAIDIETTSKRDLELEFSNPYSANIIHRVGMECTDLLDVHHYTMYKNNEHSISQAYCDYVIENSEYVVGMNLSFDLGYLLAKHWINPQDLEKPVLWDIGIFHYLYRGQQTYPSMEDIATFHHLEGKSANIEHLIEHFGDTDKIPDSVLYPYLKQDVQLAHKIFLLQKEYLEQREPSEIHLYVSEMAACKEYILATYYGINIDVEQLNLEEMQLNTLNNLVQTNFHTELERSVNLVGVHDCINSTNTIKQILFSDHIEVTSETLGEVYKSGARRGTQKVLKKKESCLVPGNCSTQLPLSTSEEVIQARIQEFSRLGISAEIRIKLLRFVLAYRTNLKSLKTYCAGIRKFMGKDQVIHPRYVQVSTATGRISATQPNIQNQP